jgi:hypothetical protein
MRFFSSLSQQYLNFVASSATGEGEGSGRLKLFIGRRNNRACMTHMSRTTTGPIQVNRVFGRAN